MFTIIRKLRTKHEIIVKEWYDNLHQQITYVLSNSQYYLISLTVDYNHMGNAIVVVCSKNSGTVYRFIDDRGDIYIERKFGENGWGLFKCAPREIHEHPTQNPYSLLITTITEFVQIVE